MSGLSSTITRPQKFSYLDLDVCHTFQVQVTWAQSTAWSKTESMASETLGCLMYFVFPFVVVLWWIKSSSNALKLIPGPRPVPLLGNLVQLMEVVNIHKSLTRWQRKFGPVFKIRFLSLDTVVISGYDALHEALILKGTETGGRSYHFRSNYIGLGTGILTSSETDATWRALRKLGQSHLKQFGDSLSRLEAIIEELAEDMFQTFQNEASRPFDPRHVVRETAAKTISFLLSGQRVKSGDPILEKMETYEKLLLKAAAPITHPRLMMYDWMPWLRHLGLKTELAGNPSRDRSAKRLVGRDQGHGQEVPRKQKLCSTAVVTLPRCR